MSNLTNTKIQDTYGGVLNIGPSGASASLQPVTDGFGNVLPFEVSNTEIAFTGIVTGITGAGGSSGTSGINGSSGTSGVNGAPGAPGANGSSGTSGVSGSSGTSGINGANGSSGTSGVNGDNGSSGTSGVNGANGSSGTSGVNGDNGSSGTSGVNGSSGTSGVNGESGSSGTSGVSGSSGTSGINGESGSSGTSGINGESGSSGTSGINGESGSSGTSGINGESGSSGTSGINGENGSSGSSGTSGISGSSGTSGVNGESGSSGTSGVNGEAGSSGTSGINGDPGATGATGAQGNVGPIGPPSGSRNGFVSTSPGTTVTGTTDETISDFILVPANTFQAGDWLVLNWFTSRLNTTGSIAPRVYFNTTNSLAGATQIAVTTTMTGGSLTNTNALRNIRIRTSDGSGDGTNVFNSTGAQFSDYISAVTSTFAIDWTADVYIIFAITLGDPAGQALTHGWSLMTTSGQKGDTGATGPAGDSPITIQNTGSLISTGVGATGTANVAVVIGSCASGNGLNGIAIGINSAANSENSISIGNCARNGTFNAGTQSVNIGTSARAGQDSIGIGLNVNTDGVKSVTIGSNTQVNSNCGISIGECNIFDCGYLNSRLVIGSSNTIRSCNSGIFGLSSCVAPSMPGAFIIGNSLTSEFSNTTHVDSLVAFGQGVSKFNDAGNSAGEFELNWNNGNNQQVTLVESITSLVLSNPIAGGNYSIKVIQGAGPYTITWPASIKWANGATPILSTGTGEIDIITLIYDGTNYYGAAAYDFS